MKDGTYTQLIEFCARISISELIQYKKYVRHTKNKRYLIAKVVLDIRLSRKGNINDTYY